MTYFLDTPSFMPVTIPSLRMPRSSLRGTKMGNWFVWAQGLPSKSTNDQSVGSSVATPFSLSVQLPLFRKGIIDSESDVFGGQVRQSSF